VHIVIRIQSFELIQGDFPFGYGGTFRASSFTSRSLVSSCVFTSALRCSFRWIPSSCKGSVKCNNDGWHEASNNSKCKELGLVPDMLPPPVVCTLPSFQERTGEVAPEEPPGRARGIFLGRCWETGSKSPLVCVLNEFFKGELGTGYTNMSLARIQKKMITYYTGPVDGHFPRPIDYSPPHPRASWIWVFWRVLGHRHRFYCSSVYFSIRRLQDMDLAYSTFGTSWREA